MFLTPTKETTAVIRQLGIRSVGEFCFVSNSYDSFNFIWMKPAMHDFKDNKQWRIYQLAGM